MKLGQVNWSGRVTAAIFEDGLARVIPYYTLQELIRRCLQREPKNRFASAEELRREIAHIRRYVPPAAPSELAAYVNRLLQPSSA